MKSKDRPPVFDQLHLLLYIHNYTHIHNLGQIAGRAAQATSSPRVPRPPESTTSGQPKPSLEAAGLPWPQTGITLTALQQQREDLNLDQKRVSTCDWALATSTTRQAASCAEHAPRHPDATSICHLSHQSTSQARNWLAQLRLYSWLLHALSSTGQDLSGQEQGYGPASWILTSWVLVPPPSYWAGHTPGWLGICMLFREP